MSRWAGLTAALRRPLTLAVVLELAILGSLLGLRLHAIAATMPYPIHIDEPYLTEPAGRVLTEGDWNPHFFMYPSLPIYVTAGAFSAGYLSAASHGEVTSTRDIGTVGYPFYRQARVVWPAKILFVLFSLVAAAGAAWVAYHLTGESALLALVPLILALSPAHDQFSWTYLNVNTMGDALVWSTLVFLLAKLDDTRFAAKTWIPGLLVGATTATKYNFATLAIPALLAIAWKGGDRRGAKALGLAVAAALTFVVTVPYAILDTPAFLTDLGKIMGIYQDGFVNNEAPPGLPHLLLNLRNVVADLGWLTLPFGLAGLWHLVRKRPAATGLVLSFPLALLLHMSLQKAHFLRNLLSLFPLYALLVAVGLVIAYRAAVAALATHKANERWRRLVPGTAVTLAALVVLPVNLRHPVAQWAPTIDSRKVAVEWLLTNLPPHSSLVVAEELSIDLRPVAKAGHAVRRVRFRQETPSSLLARLAEHDADAIVLYPVFGAGHWDKAIQTANLPVAAELNRPRNRLVPMHEFGTGDVSVIFDHVLVSSPRFVVGRLNLSAAERAGLGRPQAVPLDSFTAEPDAPVQLSANEIALFGSGPVRSKPVALTAGRWRLVMLGRGTAARGKYAKLRFRLGERELGVVTTKDPLREEVLEFELSADLEAPLEIALVNDGVGRLADGTPEDRNAYLRAIQLFSLGPLAPASR